MLEKHMLQVSEVILKYLAQLRTEPSKQTALPIKTFPLNPVQFLQLLHALYNFVKRNKFLTYSVNFA